MQTAHELYKRLTARLPDTLDLDGKIVMREVLAALAARLTADEAAELGGDLPEELGDILADAHGARGFDRDDLFEHVAERLDLDDDDAESAVLAVMGVLRGAIVPIVEIEQVLEVLPPELAQLMR